MPIIDGMDILPGGSAGSSGFGTGEQPPFVAASTPPLVPPSTLTPEYGPRMSPPPASPGLASFGAAPSLGGDTAGRPQFSLTWGSRSSRRQMSPRAAFWSALAVIVAINAVFLGFAVGHARTANRLQAHGVRTDATVVGVGYSSSGSSRSSITVRFPTQRGTVTARLASGGRGAGIARTGDLMLVQYDPSQPTTVMAVSQLHSAFSGLWVLVMFDAAFGWALVMLRRKLLT